MGKCRPHLAWLLLAALAVLLQSGCRTWTPAIAGRREVLRVGAVADAPPFLFRNRREWKGLEADLARALAERLHMRLVWVDLASEEPLPALLSGHVDVLMGGRVITEEQRVQIDFSTPFLVIGQSALVRYPDHLLFNTESRLLAATGRIAVLKGSPAEEMVARYFTQSTPVPADTHAEAVDALLARQVEMVVSEAPGLWWTARQYPRELALCPVLFARKEVSWGFRRGSLLLRESVNQAFDEWQRNGTLEEVLRRWIPLSP